MSLIPFGFWAASGAGGGGSAYDLLETTTLSSSASSVTFDNLTSTYGGDYKHLQFRLLVNRTSDNPDANTMLFRFNNVSSSGSYMSHQLYGSGSAVVSRALSNTAGYLRGALAGEGVTKPSPVIMDILDFADTNKAIVSRTMSGLIAQYGQAVSLESAMLTTGAAALTQVTFLNLGTHTFSTGNRFSIYGVK
jgi:hypothetical protein